MLKAASEGLCLQYLITEVGVQAGLHLRGDSSASHGTLQRLGSGRVEHLQTRQLWLQEKVYSGEVTVEKIPRERNWADLLTHAWSPASWGLFGDMGIHSVSGADGEQGGATRQHITKSIPNRPSHCPYPFAWPLLRYCLM